MLQKVFIPKITPFDGIFGVFSDSLPDGWGRLLVDRLMLKKHINPYEIGNLNRLAIVGNSGMGALTYEPVYNFYEKESSIDLDVIAKECSKILKTDYSDNLDELFRLGGSSGGARPKIFTQIDGEEWIIKFPSSEDNIDIGKQKNEKEKRWILPPAYDLTFSYSIGGEHATTIHGNGKNPGMEDILEVAKSIGMNQSSAKIIAKDVKECVNEKLGLYLNR